MLLTERLKTPQIIIPATLGTIVLTMLLPILVHSIPVQGAPMGARILPIFLAPLLAIYLFHPAVALMASLVTPYLNQLLTGNPPPAMMFTLTGELIIFSSLCLLLLKRFPKLWFIAPLAYMVAKALTQVILKLSQLVPTPPWQSFFPSLSLAIPGLILLLVINFILVKTSSRS